MKKLYVLGMLAGGMVSPVIAEVSSYVLYSDHPAKNWAAECYPIGNARLGAMFFGGVDEEVIQFNENSLWGGDNNWDGGYQLGDHGFGNYRNFGEFSIQFGKSVGLSSPTGHEKGNGQGIDLTIDGHANSKWCVESPGDTVRWQASLDKGQKLKSYSLTSAPDVPERDPKDWVLEGSNDGAKWTTVDQQSGKSSFESRGQKKTFTLAKEVEFKHYRFTFQTKGYSHFQVSEVSLDGVSIPKSGESSLVTNYRRELDLEQAMHRISYSQSGVSYTREAFASHPAQVMVFRYRSSAGMTGKIKLKSAQGAVTTATANGLAFAGVQPNQLAYAASMSVVPQGGVVRTEGDQVAFENCKELVLYLNARTNYKASYQDQWRGEAPGAKMEKELAAAKIKGFDKLKKEHQKDIDGIIHRVSLDVGTTDPEVLKKPLAERKKLLAQGGSDPDLQELMFQYGRYLLVSSSRPGGLPANLQGLWNNSNNPPWAADYHNNINVQMNYWPAEPANLSECHQALIDYVVAQSEPCRVATKKEFGEKTRGWTARTSQSIFGGNGWEWNIPASAWYACHIYEHWAFTQDRDYLKKTAYPVLKEICEMWEDRLKTREDGLLVVPNGWSPEHGPREDGVMHDQQLIWELFQNYIEAADVLGVDKAFRDKVAFMQSKLAPNKIGNWGQLQEWQADRDSADDQHRHTSHLFGVYPGRQITREKTPELAEAAKVSLLSRSGAYGKNKGKPFVVDSTVGDSRQSWAWPWRCALWARLGEQEKCEIMIKGLLIHNSADNLFCIASRVFQMDGNFGITAAMCEMLVQSQSGDLLLVPALPASWAKKGSFKGLKARGGLTVDCEWQDGKVTKYEISSKVAKKIKIRVNGETKEITTKVSKN